MYRLALSPVKTTSSFINQDDRRGAQATRPPAELRTFGPKAMERFAMWVSLRYIAEYKSNARDGSRFHLAGLLAVIPIAEFRRPAP